MSKAKGPPPFSGDQGDAEGDRPDEATAETLAVAQYLGDMIGQLEAMARAARLDLLVYLLSMAREEAQARALPGARSED